MIGNLGEEIKYNNTSQAINFFLSLFYDQK